MTSVFQEPEIHLRDYLYILRKRKKLMWLILFLALVSGALFTYFEKVLYRATATILIERENPNVVDFKEVMSLDASTTDYYQTQHQMLKSLSLIDELIEKENLAQDSHLLNLQRGFLRRFTPLGLPQPSWLKKFLAPSRLSEVFVRRMLQVRPLRNSRLVQVSVLHPDPLRASEMTNRLVDLFIQQNLENRFLISRQATELIAQQLVELKEKVARAEEGLQDYKEKSKLVNIPSIREKDQFIQDAKLELVKLQAEESKLSKRYLEAHPERIRIRSQIQGLEEKITQEEEKNLELSRTAVEYAQLEREAESARKIYESLLSRLEETHSEAKAQASNILVVDSAKVPQIPFKPRPVLNLLVAFFLGITGGIFLAFFSEYFDPTVKIPDDIEKGLGLELLGAIPRVSPAEKNASGTELLFVPGVASAASESFRALRTAFLFRLRHMEGCRALLITSPNPQEGKSTIALNLAAAFQQNHLKILLIDADLRKGQLHKRLNVAAAVPGLSDVLEGKYPLSQALHRNVAELGFDFLSCGSISDHPTEILGTPVLKEVLESLKPQYDLIVLDSSPYLAVADVIVLSEYADAIAVVCRYHKTDKRHLRDSRRRFGNVPGKFFGIVINQVGVREKDYYYHQYYYYGYGENVPKK